MNKQASKTSSKLDTVAARKIAAWGVDAFARHCRKLGISLDDCLYMVTGQTQVRKQVKINFMHKA